MQGNVTEIIKCLALLLSKMRHLSTEWNCCMEFTPLGMFDNDYKRETMCLGIMKSVKKKAF